MREIELPPDIRWAIIRKIRQQQRANGVIVLEREASEWIDDVMKHGNRSLFFNQVSPAALDFLAPVFNAYIPLIKTVWSSLGPALSSRAEEINSRMDEETPPPAASVSRPEVCVFETLLLAPDAHGMISLAHDIATPVTVFAFDEDGSPLYPVVISTHSMGVIRISAMGVSPSYGSAVATGYETRRIAKVVCTGE